jgi:ubiquitin carboxyl-terminal hydrolase 16/45
MDRIDDFVSYPETLDLAPYLAPDRNDYKTVMTPTGPRARYMDWTTPEQGPELTPVMYKLYGA